MSNERVIAFRDQRYVHDPLVQVVGRVRRTEAEAGGGIVPPSAAAIEECLHEFPPAVLLLGQARKLYEMLVSLGVGGQIFVCDVLDLEAKQAQANLGQFGSELPLRRRDRRAAECRGPRRFMAGAIDSPRPRGPGPSPLTPARLPARKRRRP